MTITDIQRTQTVPASVGEPKGLRAAAEQFEAILLNQLTSALSKTEETDGEENLFGGDGGTGLAKQMFAEQMAETMAKSGGVGLADLIVQRAAQSAGHKAGPEEARVEGSRSFSKILSEDKPLMKVANEGVRRPLITAAASESIATQPPSRATNLETAALVLPAKGRISSGFGTRFHPIDKKSKFHDGIDIAVPRGTPVKAAADGVVKFAGWRGGYGFAVVVEHADGTETLYAHNEKILVEEGQPVDRGDQLSLSGSTGKSTGPHLHFEVRQNGIPVNPMAYLTNVLGRTADR